jgi:hypothetical protein
MATARVPIAVPATFAHGRAAAAALGPSSYRDRELIRVDPNPSCINLFARVISSRAHAR